MKYLILLLLFVPSFILKAQNTGNNSPNYYLKGNVSIAKGTQYADPSAYLEVGTNTSTKGLLFPRVTNTSSVSNPVKGLTVFSLNDSLLKVYNGVTWISLGGGSTTYLGGDQIYLAGDTFNLGTNLMTGKGSIANGSTYFIYGDPSFTSDIMYMALTNLGGNKDFNVNVADTLTKITNIYDQNNLSFSNALTKVGQIYSTIVLGDSNRVLIQTPKKLQIIANDSISCNAGSQYKTSLSDGSKISIDSSINGFAISSGDLNSFSDFAATYGSKGTSSSASQILLISKNTLGGGSATNIQESTTSNTGHSLQMYTTSSENRMLVTDFNNNRGIEYSGRFEHNFTDSTLITKRYTDSTVKANSASDTAFVVTLSTSNATPTTIATIPIPTNAVWAVQFRSSAKQSIIPFTGEASSFNSSILVGNMLGVVTVLGGGQVNIFTPIQTTTMIGTSVTEVASGSNLLIQVTGEPTTNINWRTYITIVKQP